MVKQIVKDIFFLSQKSNKATLEDIHIAKELQATLNAHRDNCVGMAANMIGYLKQIIIINMGNFDLIMFNPKIITKFGEYQTEEGCLSLVGTRECTRYQTITVRYQDLNFKTIEQTFTGFQAQIIQHEIDHLNGIII